MNRIQRIQIFLADYRHLKPSLKYLCKEGHRHYQLELMNDYIKASQQLTHCCATTDNQKPPVSGL